MIPELKKRLIELVEEEGDWETFKAYSPMLDRDLTYFIPYDHGLCVDWCYDISGFAIARGGDRKVDSFLEHIKKQMEDYNRKESGA